MQSPAPYSFGLTLLPHCPPSPASKQGLNQAIEAQIRATQVTAGAQVSILQQVRRWKGGCVCGGEMGANWVGGAR